MGRARLQPYWREGASLLVALLRLLHLLFRSKETTLPGLGPCSLLDRLRIWLMLNPKSDPVLGWYAHIPPRTALSPVPTWHLSYVKWLRPTQGRCSVGATRGCLSTDRAVLKVQSQCHHTALKLNTP